MKTAEDILKNKARAIITVDPDTRIFAALEIMAENHIGSVFVEEKGRIVGIYTERNLLKDMVKQGFDPKVATIGDHMTSPLITVQPNASVLKLQDLILGKRIRHILVEDENGKTVGVVSAGDIIGKLPRETTKTKDITGGLPRVAELFEVRKPKETAVLSEIDGYVTIGKTPSKGKQKVTVTPVDAGEKKEYLIPRGRHVGVYDGDYVKAGEQLTGGSPNPQDILNIKGDIALASYLLNGVQEVYRLQGVRINDKHIEVIVRQMIKRAEIIDPGDTSFIKGEQVEYSAMVEENERAEKEGKVPATYER